MQVGPCQAAHGGGGDDALGGAADAEQRVHAALGLAGGDGGVDVAVEDQLDARPRLPQLRDQPPPPGRPRVPLSAQLEYHEHLTERDTLSGDRYTADQRIK